MHAMIFGGNGFIGSHLVDELIGHGHDVRVFDKYPEAYRGPVSGVEYVFGDFGNRAQVFDALSDIDVVYHLISTTLPQTSNDDPAFDVQSNVVWTLSLLAQCVERSVKKFVFLSSGGTVYGMPAKLPIREDASTLPLCSYGITKLCVEKYLELFRHIHGLDFVVIRPANAFGPRQNPKNIQGAISVFLGQMLEKRPITIWGDGSVVRDYIYVKDLVAGIHEAAVSTTRNRVFNMGSGVGVALNELIQTLEECVGYESQISYMPRRSFDIPAVYLDIDRAAEELGWRPETRLEDGIAATYDFLRTESGLV